MRDMREKNNMFFFPDCSKSCWMPKSGTTCSESCSRTCRTSVNLWLPSNTHCESGLELELYSGDTRWDVCRGVREVYLYWFFLYFRSLPLHLCPVLVRAEGKLKNFHKQYRDGWNHYVANCVWYVEVLGLFFSLLFDLNMNHTITVYLNSVSQRV